MSQSTMRAASLVLLLAMGAGCAEQPRQESTGQYLDDTTITTKVKTALLNEPAVSGLAINVETYKGTVQLSGFANSERERDTAGLVAKNVRGVVAVKNDVRLKAK